MIFELLPPALLLRDRQQFIETLLFDRREPGLLEGWHNHETTQRHGKLRRIFGPSVLKKSPYDLEGVKTWLQHRATSLIDPAKDMSLEKLQEEVKKLQDERKFTIRDKMFWVAAAALGVTLSREVIDWMKTDETKQLDSFVWIAVYRNSDR